MMESHDVFELFGMIKSTMKSGLISFLTCTNQQEL